MKKIIVTGAGGNLGKFTVDYFKSKGQQVTGIWSPGKRPAELLNEDFEVDLKNESATRFCIDQVIQKNNKVDVLLAIAGGFESGSLEECSLEEIKRMINLNFDTAWNVVQPVVQQMKKQSNGGRIILIGARPAFEPEQGRAMVAYALSKSLLNELAALVNASVANNKIICSVVVPGTIDTPANRAWAGEADTSSWVTLEELAKTFEFLIGADSSKLRNPVLRMYGD